MPYADPVQRAAYHREYKRRNRGRYTVRQQAYDSAVHANERAAKYGAPGRLTADEAQDILAAGRCHYCGGAELLGLDHVKPLHAGGPNDSTNIVCACRACNSSKWRGDRPGRWSRQHDRCVDCGTSERRHSARGRCNACYLQSVKSVRVAKTPRP